MNTQRTEGKGVTVINDFIFNSNYLAPHIDFNDRTDSWDGFIFVYSDETNKKSSLLGRIPVQVKAVQVETFSKKTRSKAFDVADLINYKNDGGVILFCVECFKEYRKTYFTFLLPFDLEQLLKGVSPEQETRVVKLEEITDISEFENLCREFLIHRKNQYSLPLIDFPYDKISEIMFQGVLPPNELLEKKLVAHSQYMYGKISLDNSVYDCVTKIDIDQIKKTINSPISIEGKEYYKNYNIITQKNNMEILLGNNLRFIIKNNKLRINYSFSGRLDERINDTEFITKFINTKSIEISGNTLPLLTSFANGKEQFELIKKYNEYLKYIASLLEMFKIEHLSINLDSITKNEIKELDILINTMVLNIHYTHKEEKSFGKHKFKLGNISLLTILFYNENNKLEIYDFNAVGDQFKFNIFYNDIDSKDNKGRDACIYILLNLDDIINSSNINLNEVVKNVKSYSHSIEYDERVLLLALEIIKSYDKTNLITYLDCAEELVLWLKDGYIDKNIIIINELQINKRKHKLTQNEIEYLKNLKEKVKENISMLCAISILLEEVEIYNNYFKKLSDDEKIIFLNYPIYSLLKQ